MKLIPTRGGEVNCLGWCGKTFRSPDRANIRYCEECRKIKERRGAVVKIQKLLGERRCSNTTN